MVPQSVALRGAADIQLLGLPLLIIALGFAAGAMRRGRFWFGVVPGVLVALLSPFRMMDFGLVTRVLVYAAFGIAGSAIGWFSVRSFARYAVLTAMWTVIGLALVHALEFIANARNVLHLALAGAVVVIDLILGTITVFALPQGKVSQPPTPAPTPPSQPL